MSNEELYEKYILEMNVAMNVGDQLVFNYRFERAKYYECRYRTLREVLSDLNVDRNLADAAYERMRSKLDKTVKEVLAKELAR